MHPLTLTQAWKQMEDFHARGLIKSIGLSNFPAEEIEELSKIWTIKPTVNQVKRHLPISPPLISGNDRYQTSQGL